MNEKKWNIFLKRIWPFWFVPFVDFVFAAGSLATGKMHEDSDFDVIIGARRGRIFTARFFAVGIFRLLRWGRKHGDAKASAKNTICLNHFVTPTSYRLAPPHNPYWQHLYQSLVPVCGSPEIVQKFWDANQNWMGGRKIYQKDARHRYQKKSWVQNILEFVLGGYAGDWFEQSVKRWQMDKISARHNNYQYKPRIIVTDDELEFHPDTERTEKYEV